MQRQIFLDWLRIIALGLLILYHIGMIYVPWTFHIKSPHASSALIPWMKLTEPWRMSLLFMISGAVTVLMLKHTEPLTLIRRRSKQLLLPLLFGVALMIPPQSYFEVIEKYQYSGSYFEFLKLYFTGYSKFCNAPSGSAISNCLILPTWNHLWFLPYLFLYTCVLCAAIWLLKRFANSFKNYSGLRISGMAILLIPIIYFAFGRLFFHAKFPQTYSIVGDVYAHWLYGGAFVWGALLALRQDAWAELAHWRFPALVFSIFAWAILVFLKPNKFHEHFIISIYIAGALTAAFGFAYTWLNQEHPLRQRLTQAVFPVYIFHQTVLVAVHQGLKGFDFPVGIEASLVIALTFTISIGLYLLLQPIQWLRPWLAIANK